MAADDPATSIDAIEIDCDAYDAPRPEFLAGDADDIADETLRSDLLKSNCPVTGQPDWASVRLAYRGPRIDRAGLLRSRSEEHTSGLQSLMRLSYALFSSTTKK